MFPARPVRTDTFWQIPPELRLYSCITPPSSVLGGWTEEQAKHGLLWAKVKKKKCSFRAKRVHFCKFLRIFAAFFPAFFGRLRVWYEFSAPIAGLPQHFFVDQSPKIL
jgi:hypothetical protein